VNKRKRLWAAAACVLLLAAACPLSATAASHTVSSYADLKDQIENDPGPVVNITLDADVQADSTITVTGSKTVNISGSRTISRAAGFTGHVFTVAEGTLNLEDVTVDGASSSPSAAALVMVSGSGTLNLNDGSVLQNNRNEDEGGAVYNLGTTNMNAGSLITGNSAYEGGGIFNDGGTVTMNAGSSITGNSADDGGGIDNYAGNFYLSGGSIEGNIAGSWGGAVDNQYGNMYMSSGSVSSNTSNSDGGGIYNAGTLFVTGGSITGNSAFDGGGGIYIVGASRTEISGNTVISGNSTAGNGGGIAVQHDDLHALNIGPDVVFSDNSAQQAYARDPADDATYEDHVESTSWTNPLSQGYNNYDIQYTAGRKVYFVSFDTGGGSPEPTQAVTDGSTAAEPDDPTKPGLNFDGWYTDPALTTHYDFGTPVHGDITIYAKWTGSPVYTVEFESNGGTAVAHQDVEENGTAFRPIPPTRSGYSFAGWYLDAALTVPYDFDTPVTGNIWLYAKWNPVSPGPGPNPPTGDESHPAVWLIPAAVSGCCLAIYCRRRRKATVTPQEKD